jgi:DNA primase
MFPAKENRKTAFYFALDREEKNPSLSVDFVKNKAFDFGTGKNYDVISIVQQIKKCSVSEALEYLETLDFSISEEVDKDLENKNYQILNVNKVEHPALIEYLKLRKVFEQKHLVKEVHYELNGKKQFGIGFFNNSSGIEIRSKYSKICLGKKDITLVENQSCEICVFEGFFDYLTFRNLENAESSVSDYLILNSTAMLFKAEKLLRKYDRISLFLDNDRNGNDTKELIQKNYQNVEDCSFLYRDFKDLNEWGCQEVITKCRNFI